MTESRPAFRADLEGLRGVAILLVVLFHTGVSALAGGFVGVDVFFVLSGYFVTALLLREVEETGSVRVLDFLGRRLLRLLPALFVVLLATLLAVMTLYAPIDRAAIAKSAVATALFSGNLHFAGGTVDYFSTGDNPLLHTWTLGVEQQFYLVWPLLFAAVAWIASAAADGALFRRHLGQWMFGAAALSLGASIIVTRSAQPWAFFGTATRIWEFALGGMLWLGLDGSDDREGLGPSFQIAGMAAIGFGVLAYDSGTAYPGWLALLPALGTCALIAGGRWSPTADVAHALGSSPLRWLGRVSYAWYLWHWPLVGIAAVLDPAIGVGGRLLWSGVALLLAWATHVLVEQRSRGWRTAPRALVPLAVAASAVVALIAKGAEHAAERQASTRDQVRFAAARTDRIEHGCWANTTENSSNACLIGDLRGNVNVTLLGDSHAEHWVGALDEAGKRRGWKVNVKVKGGCPVADIPELGNRRLRRYWHECAVYREEMVRRIIASHPDVVILASWDHYVSSDVRETDNRQVSVESWREGLRRTYERFAAARIRTVVIRDVPHTPFDVPSCLSRRAAHLLASSDCRYARAGAIATASVAAQDAALLGLRVRPIDMNDQICPTAVCEVERNGEVVFTDDNHLTARFSRTLAPVLGARIAAMLP